QDDVPVPDNAYSARVRAASRCGLYANVLALDQQLAQTWPDRRIEAVSLTELDRAGITPALMVLLALRLDGLSALEIARGADRAKALAKLAGQTGDWSL